jgi:CRISPR system Cascade subunit CasA
MDNAKARCWYEHRLPSLAIDKVALPQFTGTIELVVALAIGSLSLLKSALKEAWFETPKEAKGDFSALDIAYWQETEAGFRTLLACMMQERPDEPATARTALRQWESALHQYLFVTFDRLALNNPDDNRELLRILTARRLLDKNYTKQKVLKELQTLMAERKEVQGA